MQKNARKGPDTRVSRIWSAASLLIVVHHICTLISHISDCGNGILETEGSAGDRRVLEKAGSQADESREDGEQEDEIPDVGTRFPFESVMKSELTCKLFNSWLGIDLNLKRNERDLLLLPDSRFTPALLPHCARG